RVRLHRPPPSFPTRRSSDLYLRRLHAGLPATVVPGGGTAIGAKNGGRGGEKAQVILRSPTARPILPTRFEPVVESAPRQSVHPRSEEHTSELQSPCNLVCRL